MEIIHKGTIIGVSDKDITLRISGDGGDCGGCAVAALCNKADTITLPYKGASDTLIGKHVKVETAGYTKTWAITLYLAVPVVLLVLALGIAIDCGAAEGIAALCALVVLAAWYILIYLLRRWLTHRTPFRITID